MVILNTFELIGLLHMCYENAYSYLDMIRQMIQAVTIGKRSMVCLQNGCWVEESFQIPDSWIDWKYSSDRNELVHMHGSGSREMESLGWLSVYSNDVDISPFFCSLRCCGTPTDSMLLSLFGLQHGWIPKGKLTIILADATEKIIDCTSLFTIPSTMEESDSDPDKEQKAKNSIDLSLSDVD